MSMEIFVLSDSKLASIANWQDAIHAEKLVLEFSIAGALHGIAGFLPAHLEGVSTGFECYDDDDNVSELMQTYGAVDFGNQWQHALGIRIIGDFNELVAAWMAAVAYAHATGGIVFDPQEGKIFTPQQAREVVRAIEKDRPAFEAAVRKIEKTFRATARNKK